MQTKYIVNSNTFKSFKYTAKSSGNTAAAGNAFVKMQQSLKDLSTFWWSLEMSLSQSCIET